MEEIRPFGVGSSSSAYCSASDLRAMLESIVSVWGFAIKPKFRDFFFLFFFFSAAEKSRCGEGVTCLSGLEAIEWGGLVRRSGLIPAISPPCSLVCIIVSFLSFDSTSHRLGSLALAMFGRRFFSTARVLQHDNPLVCFPDSF